MKDVVDIVDKILMNLDDEKIIGGVKNEVEELMSRFPLYPEL
jgi:glycine hydroxymethyltransferase